MIKEKRVVFLGSSLLGVKCFKHLLSCPDIKTIALLTYPPKIGGIYDLAYKELIELARRHSVTLIEKEEDLLQFDLDIGFTVHHLKIIEKPIIDHFSVGIVNLHSGPLPEYRGNFPFIHAICDGESAYGSTIHFIDEGIDTGPIIKSSECDIGPEETSWQLFEKLRTILYDDFVSILSSVISGAVKATPQSEIIKSTNIQPKTYTRSMLEEKRKIDSSWPQEKIYNHVRAFQFPGIEPAYAIINGKKIYLKVNL